MSAWQIVPANNSTWSKSTCYFFLIILRSSRLSIPSYALTLHNDFIKFKESSREPCEKLKRKTVSRKPLQIKHLVIQTVESLNMWHKDVTCRGDNFKIERHKRKIIPGCARRGCFGFTSTPAFAILYRDFTLNFHGHFTFTTNKRIAVRFKIRNHAE